MTVNKVITSIVVLALTSSVSGHYLQQLAELEKPFRHSGPPIGRDVKFFKIKKSQMAKKNKLISRSQQSDELTKQHFPYNVAKQQFPAFIKSIGFEVGFPVSSISSISGYYEQEQYSILEAYFLEIRLSSARKYSIEYVEAENKKKVILDFFDSQTGNFTFKEPVKQITPLKAYGFTADPNEPMYVQNSTGNPQILRIVFIREGTYRRVELIVDEKAQRILKCRFSSKGFVQLKYLEKKEPSLKSQIFPKVNSDNKQVFPFLTHASVKLILVREIGDVYDFQVVYETTDSAYRIKSVVVNKVPKAYSYRALYGNLKLPKYMYPHIQDQKFVPKGVALQMKEFQAIKIYFFEENPHFNQSAYLINLFIVTNSSQIIVLQAFLLSKYSITFLLAQYNYNTKQPTILANFLIDPKNIKLPHCLKTSPRFDYCVQCWPNYVLAMNQQCYKKVNHCQISSATYCLACKTSYVLNETANACQIS